MTECRRPARDPEPLIERVWRGGLLIVFAFGYASLFLLLMAASEVLWRWLGWG